MRRVIIIAMVLVVVGVFLPTPVSAMTGSGTEGDPYIIGDVDDLQDMELELDAYYELGSHIDASETSGWNEGFGFVPIGQGSPYFTGSFDGAGYIISGLFIDRPSTDYIGLFGVCDGATITDAILTGVDILGDDNVGGLVGYDTGSIITGSYTTGDVYGVGSSDDVGGLVGTAYNSCIYTNCHSTATVTGGAGSTNVGGLIGRDSGTSTYTTCYATGNVTGVDYTGGFVGGITGGSSFTECCATGSIIGSTDFVGGFAGRISSGTGTTFSQCFAIGDVTSTGGTWAVGGFIGDANVDWTITNCYAMGDVAGSWATAVGGFIGYSNLGTVTNCYSVGAVAGSASVGGFCGDAGGDTVFADCFWDTQTSGQPTSDGGTGKTTSQMTTESTFTSVGWDFDTIWAMAEYVNDGYPCFDWWYDPYPFSDYDVYQVQWFEPIAIISGTTLPDRTSTQNGVITWGANPAGIAIVMGEFVSEDQPPIASSPEYPPTSIPDMTGESGQPDWTAAQPTLTDNPFYPLVSMVSDNTNIPVWLVWVIVALLILFIIMMVSFRYAPHQLITAFAGGGWSAFMYSMGIFPFWVIFIFVVMAAAIVIGERTPTVS